jgi:hypothetical protein
MMRTGYDRSGRSGVRPRYYCAAETTYLGRKAPYCQSAGGRELEKAVLAEVFAALALADAEAARAGRDRSAPPRRRRASRRDRLAFTSPRPGARLGHRSLAWPKSSAGQLI